MAGHTLMSVGAEGQGVRLIARAPAANGQRLTLGYGGRTFEALLPLAGAFQASNALVAAGLCIASGEDAGEVFAALETIQGAPGRLQRVGRAPRGGEAYVDYAHTPDGLETVLKALRPHAKGRLLVVFGAGGDRDTTKRPLMGKAAHDLADLVIVTDDNPRGEEPSSIRAAILAAAPAALEIGDRREAIEAAVAQLREGDVLVVAGKGHEQGQIVAGVTHPFDDVTEVAAALGVSHG
ncbi:MAG: cyanophycin synthetase [Caulobacteraceae bacterium]